MAKPRLSDRFKMQIPLIGIETEMNCCRPPYLKAFNESNPINKAFIFIDFSLEIVIRAKCCSDLIIYLWIIIFVVVGFVLFWKGRRNALHSEAVAQRSGMSGQCKWVTAADPLIVRGIIHYIHRH